MLYGPAAINSRAYVAPETQPRGVSLTINELEYSSLWLSKARAFRKKSAEEESILARWVGPSGRSRCGGGMGSKGHGGEA